MKKYQKYLLQCHSFRSRFTKLQYVCWIKSRHSVLKSNFSLWYSTTTDYLSDKIQMFYGQLFHFCKNCITCASRWIPAYVLVFLLAVMTPVLFACLFCPKEKITANCYTFQSTILQQILKSVKEIELPVFIYLMWLFTMAMMMGLKNILK